MSANELIKLLIAINLEVFIKIARFKDIKFFLALIEKEKNQKNTFAV